MTPGLDEAVRRYAARPAVLVALDVDGVLAPLVDRPEDARVLPASAAAVERLVPFPAVSVALVTGRSLESLLGLWQPPPGVRVVASHGAEVSGVGGVDGLDRHDGLHRHDGSSPTDLTSAQAEALAEARAAVAAVVERHPGTHAETKPAGVVLHTRTADRPVAAAAVAALESLVPSLSGVHVLPGKEVVELSVVDADKGRALTALRATVGADAVLYVGDDVTDEFAFAALDPALGDVGVKVGPGPTCAEHRLGSPADVSALLEHLLSLRAAPDAPDRSGDGHGLRQ